MTDGRESLGTGVPRFEELMHEVAALKLPADSFAVFGSGPLAAVGIRDVDDIDLIVTAELWEDLKARHAVVGLEDGGSKIVLGNVEIYDSWDTDVGDIEELIANADVIDGVRFVMLDKVTQWKQARARDKDVADLQLIDRHRNKSP